MVKKIILLIVMVCLVAIGVAMTLKANIGVGAFDALSASVAGATGIQIGTIIIVLNCTCIFIQISILKKNFKKMQLFQFVISALIGMVVNFILYNILSTFTLDSYYLQLLFLILGYVIIAAAVAVVMTMNVVAFPLEGLCKAISDKFDKKFHVVRQLADVFSIALALFIIVVFNGELSIREGTIIGVLMFGPLMGYFMRIFTPSLEKYGFIEKE